MFFTPTPRPTPGGANKKRAARLTYRAARAIAIITYFSAAETQMRKHSIVSANPWQHLVCQQVKVPRTAVDGAQIAVTRTGLHAADDGRALAQRVPV